MTSHCNSRVLYWKLKFKQQKIMIYCYCCTMKRNVKRESIFIEGNPVSILPSPQPQQIPVRVVRVSRPVIERTVEGLYCKRPIQYLASSKILTGECVLPPHQRRGEDTLAGGVGVGGQYFGRRRHCSVLYICKYFAERTIGEAYDKGR